MRFPRLSSRQRGELRFWIRSIRDIERWYDGRQTLFNQPPPEPEQRIAGYDHRTNALLTWNRVQLGKYPTRLQLDPHALAGRRVLDIGCGPIPQLLAFHDCERIGLDQLISAYGAIGWPLDRYRDEMSFLEGSSESMPAEDDSFDVVLAVNALDHVDDFAATAREIDRVLRPGGLLRFQVHYHAPTTCEPLTLSDDLIREHFGHLKIDKLAEEPAPAFHHEGVLALWSTPMA